MSAQSIEWHEDCARNWELENQRERGKLQRIITSVERSEMQLRYYQRQIQRAKKMGRKSFDADLFRAEEGQ